MAVKEKIGRKRYIAFEVVEDRNGLTRGKLSRAIGAASEESLRAAQIDVILIEGGRGIVRTDHRHSEALKALLRSFVSEQNGFELRPLRTSGTIRKLKRKYFSEMARM